MDTQLYRFLDSNLFQTIILLLTGLIGIYVYFLGKRVEKKNAAQIILMELRNAEKTIQNIKAANVIAATESIMATNSWSKYNHLFVDVLDQDELDLINRFYSQAEFAEEQRKRILNVIPLAIEEKMRATQRGLVDMAIQKADKPLEESEKWYTQTRELLIKQINDEEFTFSPNFPQEQLKLLLTNMSVVTTSSVGVKLKKIALASALWCHRYN